MVFSVPRKSNDDLKHALLKFEKVIVETHDFLQLQNSILDVAVEKLEQEAVDDIFGISRLRKECAAYSSKFGKLRTLLDEAKSNS
jgi:hypothetical protein